MFSCYVKKNYGGITIALLNKQMDAGSYKLIKQNKNNTRQIIYVQNLIIKWVSLTICFSEKKKFCLCFIKLYVTIISLQIGIKFIKMNKTIKIDKKH